MSKYVQIRLIVDKHVIIIYMNKQSIDPNRVYTTAEAADLIGTSERTIIDEIQDTKIKATHLGKGWKILGSQLLEYLKAPGVTRGYQLDKMNKAIRRLLKAVEEDKNFDLGVFLHQSINMNADEGTLSKIIADVERYASKRE